MKAALITEYRKLFSTRMWWILLGVMFAYMAFMAAVMSFSLTRDPNSVQTTGGGSPTLDGEAIAHSVYTLGNTMGYVFPLVIGALAMTGEFRHQTITPTLLVEPRRNVFLAAKLISALAVGLFFGVVGTIGAVAAGAPLLAWLGDGAHLVDSEVLTAIGLSVVALTIWTLLGVGLGTLLPNQVVAVVVVLAFTQFVEPILRVAMSAVDALSGVAQFLPGAAAEALVGSSLYSEAGMTGLLERWQGLLVLVGYGVVLAGLGRLTTLRRDIT